MSFMLPHPFALIKIHDLQLGHRNLRFVSSSLRWSIFHCKTFQSQLYLEFLLFSVSLFTYSISLFTTRCPLLTDSYTKLNLCSARIHHDATCFPLVIADPSFISLWRKKKWRSMKRSKDPCNLRWVLLRNIKPGGEWKKDHGAECNWLGIIWEKEEIHLGK